MGRYYEINVKESSKELTLLQLRFLEPGQNDLIVRDAVETMEQLDLEGGELVKFNGPASIPVAMALAHSVAHIFEVVAFFDPKIHQYVVAISHHPTIRVGDRLD